MAYHEWGSADNERVVVCVHGLARNSRDFDHLARVLAREYRVICPDIVGRGESDWLANGQGYGIPQYMNDITTLLARLNVDTVDWVGTSMGGLIALGLQGAQAMSALLRPARPGPGLGAEPLQLPLGRVVLNDVGPALDMTGLQRISEYVGQSTHVAGTLDVVLAS